MAKVEVTKIIPRKVDSSILFNFSSRTGSLKSKKTLKKGSIKSTKSSKDQIIDDFSSADGLSQFKRISNDSQRNDYDNYDNDKLIYSVES